jgi:hypothetical protein
MFTLSAFPSPVVPRTVRAPLGFSLSFAPGNYSPRTSGRGPVSDTDRELRLGHQTRPPIDVLTHFVRPRVAPQLGTSVRWPTSPSVTSGLRQNQCTMAWPDLGSTALSWAAAVRLEGSMRGDEARVVAAFVAWLESCGWSVETEVAYADVVARRGDAILYCEAKGRTAAIGLDMDTLYGQVLRRMPAEPSPDTTFGVVVPTAAVGAAQRVPLWVREQLNIVIYEVGDDGSVAER